MSRTKITAYLDNDLYRAISFYQAQVMEDETVSDLINRVLRNYLDDPFVWEDTMMYAKAFPKDEEE